MGCANDRVETSQIAAEPKPVLPSDLPPPVAFEIPSSNAQSKRKKPPHLAKPLYIIREVSHLQPDRQSSLNDSPARYPPQRPTEPEETADPPLSPHHTHQSSHEEKSRGRVSRSGRLMEGDLEQSSFYSRGRGQRGHSEDVRESRKRKVSHDETSLGKQSVHFKRARTLHDESLHETRSHHAPPSPQPSEPAFTPARFSPRLPNAQDLLLQIDETTQTEGPQSGELIGLYHELIEVYAREQKLEEAVAACGKLGHIVKRSLGMASGNYGAVQALLGSLLAGLGREKAAMEHWVHARECRAWVEAEADLHKARVLLELAMIQGQDDHALMQAESIHKRVGEQFGLTVPQGKGVMKGLQRGLWLSERIFGDNHLQTADHLDNLASAYFADHRISDFVRCYARCFAATHTLHCPKEHNIHAGHFSLSLEQLELGDNYSAEELAEVQQLTKQYFPTHPLLPALSALLH